MLNKKIEIALNRQITEEFFSAHLYLSMSAYFGNENLSGFANWTLLQYKEEVSHGMRFFNYIIERGGRVNLEKIDTPQTSWKSPLAAFEDVLAHEQKITDCINKLVTLAKSEKDYATDNMLQWFVTEQVEEEASASDILQKLQFTKGSNSSLLFLDGQLSKRK